jgi:hypothetical protein
MRAKINAAETKNKETSPYGLVSLFEYGSKPGDGFFY